jgi:hypothetical protein
MGAHTVPPPKRPVSNVSSSMFGTASLPNKSKQDRRTQHTDALFGNGVRATVPTWMACDISINVIHSELHVTRQVGVSRVTTPYNVAVGRQRFGGPCCLPYLPEDGDSKVLRNVGILQHYTASQPGKPRLESSPMWKPQIARHTRGKTPRDRTTISSSQSEHSKTWHQHENCCPRVRSLLTPDTTTPPPPPLSVYLFAPDRQVEKHWHSLWRRIEQRNTTLLQKSINLETRNITALPVHIKLNYVR